MAVIVLRPSSDGTVTGWTRFDPTSTWASKIDDDPDSNDGGSTCVVSPNAASGTMFVELDDVPADFDPDAINSIEIKVAHRRANTPVMAVDQGTVNAFLTRADEVTAISTTPTAVSSPIQDPAFAVTAFAPSPTGTHTVAEWNGARLALVFTHTSVQTIDTVNQIRITAAEVTIDYTPASSEADGSSSGVATVAAIGTALWLSVASAAGLAAGPGIGAATSASVGAAAGVGAASGVGTKVVSAVANAAGVSGSPSPSRLGGFILPWEWYRLALRGVPSVEGVGSAIVSSSSSAAGTSTAAAVGDVVQGIGVGSAAGSSTVVASSISTAASVAASAGVGTASGTGAATIAASGSSAGTGAVTGVGRATSASTASSAGVGVAAGAGQATAAATASSSGTSTVTAVAAGASIASSAGTSSVTGIAAATSASAASSSGVASVVATGVKIVGGVGVSAGTSTASAQAVAFSTAAASTSGTATSEGVGNATFAGVGVSSGSASGLAVGFADDGSGSTGVAVGSSTAFAYAVLTEDIYPITGERWAAVAGDQPWDQVTGVLWATVDGTAWPEVSE